MPTVTKSLLRNIILSVVVTLILILGCLFLYFEIKLETQNLTETLLQTSILEKKERGFSGARESLKDFSSEILTLHKSFVFENAFADFVTFLENLAHEAGVKFKAESAIIGDETSISFSLEGDFVSISRFFALLDHIPYSGILDSVMINSKTENSKILAATANYIIFNFIKI